MAELMLYLSYIFYGIIVLTAIVLVYYIPKIFYLLKDQKKENDKNIPPNQ